MNKTKGVLSALIGSATFGMIPFFAVPLLNKGMSPPCILFYRNLFCAIFIGIFCIVSKKSMRIPIKILGRFLFMSLLYILSSIPMLYSFRYIPTGMSTTIHFMYPIGVTLILGFILKEKKSRKQLFLALASFIGVAILCYRGGSNAVDIRGVLLALVTVVAYSSYIVLLEKLMKVYKADSDVYVFYLMSCNTILLALISLFITGFSGIPSGMGSFQLLGLVVISTIVPNVLFMVAVKNIGATTSSILCSMEPFTATLIGILHFAEPFSWHTVIGFVIIIASVIMVIISNRKTNKKEQKIIEESAQ